MAADVGDRCGSAEALFLDRVCKVLGDHCAHRMIEEPWEHIEKRQTFPDRILRESILPALFAACGDRAIWSLIVGANGPQPQPEVAS